MIPTSIVRGFFLVLATINFDNQTSFQTDKIYYVRPDRTLAAKSVS